MSAYDSVIQAHRLKIEGQEADCFAQFPAYIERLEASDPDTQSVLAVDSTDGGFQAAAFAPAAMKKAFRWIRKFVALDACHTRSKFRMMLWESMLMTISYHCHGHLFLQRMTNGGHGIASS